MNSECEALKFVFLNRLVSKVYHLFNYNNQPIEGQQLLKIDNFKHLSSKNTFGIKIYDSLGGSDAKEWVNILISQYQEVFQKDLTCIPSKYFKQCINEVGKHKFIRSRKGKRQTSIVILELYWEKDFLFRLEKEDVTMSTGASSGPGGQNRDKSNTKTQLIYKPLNIVIAEQGSRSFEQNLNNAYVKLQTEINKLIISKLHTPKEESAKIVRIYELKNKLIVPTSPGKTIKEVIEKNLII